MLWITTTDRPTSTVTVASVHHSETAARTRAYRDHSRALPVSAARHGSKTPRVGDELAICAEASGPVAVAEVA